MADVLSKGENAMPKSSGLKSPGQLSGLVSNSPVLNNAWGSKLVGKNQSNSMGRGKGKK